MHQDLSISVVFFFLMYSQLSDRSLLLKNIHQGAVNVSRNRTNKGLAAGFEPGSSRKLTTELISSPYFGLLLD